MPLREVFPAWIRVAAFSFGGPVGQIAVMHRIFIQEKKWISDEQFAHGLNYCMLLPGPEAHQLCTYLGWRSHGILGGILAGSLFILPGFLAILALSLLYLSFHNTKFLAALFFGLRPAVVVIVVEAFLRMSRRVTKSRFTLGIALASFLAVSLFAIPYPAIVVSALILGGLHAFYVRGRDSAQQSAGPLAASAREGDTLPGPQFGAALSSKNGRNHWLARSLTIALVGLPLWLGPVIACAAIGGSDSIFTQLGFFFSKAAVVTFGGAYTVLNYVEQQAVENFHWLQKREMLDGLGMAETTPGPLIMVLQFVGHLAAFRQPGELSPHVAGLLGACLTVWVTFLPSFLWVLLGAPYIQKLGHVKLFKGALAAVSAAAMGMIANLALTFFIRTMFPGEATQFDWGPIHSHVPSWSSFSISSGMLILLAGYLCLIKHLGLAVTLGVCCGLGVLMHIVLPF